MNDEAVWAALRNYQPVIWQNPRRTIAEAHLQHLPVTRSDLDEAWVRWRWFQPLIRQLFPDDVADTIWSPLERADRLAQALSLGADGQPALLLKSDSELPLAGSIKARGGFYEVLQHACTLASGSGLISTAGDATQLSRDDVRRFLSEHRLIVASTGNLGLSIGIMGRALGFQVTVIMSREAQAWKKQLLRDRRAEVREIDGDFSDALRLARDESDACPSTHFVDDERSRYLFLGYAVAAFELQAQLRAMRLALDAPIQVFIPCGVGGAAGGIAFGLAHLLGDRARCWLVEPTHAPSMLLALLSRQLGGTHISTYDIDNQTAADGLAVPVASQLAAPVLDQLAAGVCTVADEALFDMLALLRDTQGKQIEPSAAAAIVAAQRMAEAFDQPDSTFVAWTTGGLLLPADIYESMYARGGGHGSRS